MTSQNIKKNARDKTTEELELSGPIARLVGNTLVGIANAAQRCANNPNPRCVKNQKGGQIVDDVTSAISLGGEVLTRGEEIAKTVVKAIIKMADTLVPVVQEAIFGDLADEPWEQVAPELVSALKKDAKLMENVINNPAMQDAIKELAEAYATVAIQMIDAVRPSIDMMTEEVWESISQVANKSAIGIINTALNFSEAAIGEVPVFGGLIDLIIAIIRGINKAMLAASPAVELGVTTVGTGIETGKKLIGTATKGVEKISAATTAFSNAAQSLDKLTEKATNIGEAMGSQIKQQMDKTTQAAKTKIDATTQAATQAAKEKVAATTQAATQAVTQPITRAVAPVAKKGGSKQRKFNATKKRLMKKIKKFTMRKPRFAHKHK